MSQFNEHSTDAMFARVLARLDEQDRGRIHSNAEFLVILTEIRTEARRTNGRITALERWRDVLTAKSAMIATAASVVVTVLVKIFVG